MRPSDRSSLPTVLLLGIVLLVGSCSKSPTTSPDQQQSVLRGATHVAVHGARGTGERMLQGAIGPGSQYVIWVPESWNGDLVVYAHGYTAPMFPPGIPPDEIQLMEALHQIAAQAGFAYAYSTYSQTGFGLKDASQRTDQLVDIFGSRVTPPSRTFLIGASMGGLVALKLVEAHPERYAGVLTLCGLLGGMNAEIVYASHVRVLFDYFYPGVLPGNLYELPADLDLERDIIGPAATAIAANPQAAFALSQVDQVPVPFSNGVELGGAIIQALVLQAVELEDLLDRTHGQGFFDNTKTIYTGSLPTELLKDLNCHVARYSSGEAADRFLGKYYEPTGELRLSVVSLHTSLDPVVPLFHENEYRSRVEDRGWGLNLHQTTVERYGHLIFTGEELTNAFGEMLGLAAAP